MLPRRIIEILRGLRLVLRYMRVQILSLLDIQARIARLRDQRDNQDGQPRAPRRARRRFWMKPWLLGREEHGHYDALMPEMERDDLQAYRNFIRVPPEFFQELTSEDRAQDPEEDHLLPETTECGAEVGYYNEAFGHWGDLHLFAVQLQGWQVYHYKVNTRSM